MKHSLETQEAVVWLYGIRLSLREIVETTMRSFASKSLSLAPNSGHQLRPLAKQGRRLLTTGSQDSVGIMSNAFECLEVDIRQLRSSLRDSQLFREQGYIGGRWLEAKSGESFAVTNPFNGDEIGSCPEMYSELCHNPQKRCG